MRFDVELLYVVHRYFDFVVLIHVTDVTGLGMITMFLLVTNSAVFWEMWANALL
jgi:hypothetical protein